MILSKTSCRVTFPSSSLSQLSHRRSASTLHFGTLAQYQVISALSNHHRFLILAEDLAQRVRDFTHRGITLHGVEDSGHQVFVAPRRGLDSCQRGLDQRPVPPSAQPTQ